MANNDVPDGEIRAHDRKRLGGLMRTPSAQPRRRVAEENPGPADVGVAGVALGHRRRLAQRGRLAARKEAEELDTPWSISSAIACSRCSSARGGSTSR